MKWKSSCIPSQRPSEARLLKNNQPLTIFSPKMGPMKEDFERLGLEVTIVDTTSPRF